MELQRKSREEIKGKDKIHQEQKTTQDMLDFEPPQDVLMQQDIDNTVK